MNSSALLSVIVMSELLFVSIDCLEIKGLKQMCESFKPNGVFKGIKVFVKYCHRSDEHWMYANGKEWQFVVKNRSVFQKKETLTTSDRKTGSEPTFVSKDSVLFHMNVWHSIGSDLISECFINQSDSCETSRRTAFSPTQKRTVIGVLEKKSSKKLLFYSVGGQTLDQSFCGEVLDRNYDIPSFLSDIPDRWLNSLDGIIDLSNGLSDGQNSWLLFFNNSSKPLFCIVDKTMNFTEGCKNFKEYGFECNDVPNVETNSGICLQTYEWVVFVAVFWMILFLLIASEGDGFQRPNIID